MIVGLYFIIVMTFLQGSTGDCGFTLTFYKAARLVNGQIITCRATGSNFKMVRLFGTDSYNIIILLYSVESTFSMRSMLLLGVWGHAPRRAFLSTFACIIS